MYLAVSRSVCTYTTCVCVGGGGRYDNTGLGMLLLGYVNSGTVRDVTR